MQPHQTRGGLHLHHVEIAKARNVFGQRALQQLHPLRQIAQVRPQLGLVPSVHISAVQADLAADGGPQAHQQFGQGGFARSRGANDSDHLTGLSCKLHTSQNGHLLARCASDQGFHT